MYNRLQYNGRLLAKPIGWTKGYGTVHLEHLYDNAVIFLKDLGVYKMGVSMPAQGCVGKIWQLQFITLVFMLIFSSTVLSAKFSLRADRKSCIVHERWSNARFLRSACARLYRLLASPLVVA